MELRLGVDIACRAAHQASLADVRGEFLWSGRSFRTAPRDLDQLWAAGNVEGTGQVEPRPVEVEPSRTSRRATSERRRSRNDRQVPR